MIGGGLLLPRGRGFLADSKPGATPGGTGLIAAIFAGKSGASQGGAGCNKGPGIGPEFWGPLRVSESKLLAGKTFRGEPDGDLRTSWAFGGTFG